jgi:hypothetical protein
MLPSPGYLFAMHIPRDDQVSSERAIIRFFTANTCDFGISSIMKKSKINLYYKVALVLEKAALFSGWSS